MNKIGLFILVIGLGAGFNSCKKKGCTDATATNYNGKAKPRDVSQLNNFQREDLGFKNLNGLRAIETRYFRYFQ